MSIFEARARFALRRRSSSRPVVGPAASVHHQKAMNARIKTIIAEARLGSYENNSSSGGSSPASSAPSEDSDDSNSADELSDEVRVLRRHRHHASPLSSPCALDDGDDDMKHQQLMLLVLPAFAPPAIAATRAKALTDWLAGFDVDWVIGNASQPLPRREVARRVRAWAQALSAMERVFRLRKPDLITAPDKMAALGELAVASAGAMLRLVRDVSALTSSPSKLLAVLDVYVPVWETYPVLAKLFSWGPSHSVLSAAEAALADLVDAGRRCRSDLKVFIGTHYPWAPMQPGGEVHPCVGFWMGYLRCMLLRHRISLYFVLGDHVVAELISCLEAVLEEKSAAFPRGLHQVFMLNNTCAIMLHAMGSDVLKPFLPPEWVRVREERMEGYIKGYMDAAWAPVVSHMDSSHGGRRRATRPSSIIVSRRRDDDPLDAFCSELQKACGEQRRWKVPNPVLRGVLRKVVTESVVPVYRRFLEVTGAVASTGLTAEELEQQLSDLFEG